MQDAQDAIHCDNNNLKAHLLMGQSLCMIAKDTGEITKIATALERMKKGSSKSAQFSQSTVLIPTGQTFRV